MSELRANVSRSSSIAAGGTTTYELNPKGNGVLRLLDFKGNGLTLLEIRAGGEVERLGDFDSAGVDAVTFFRGHEGGFAPSGFEPMEWSNGAPIIATNDAPLRVKLTNGTGSAIVAHLVARFDPA